MTPLPLALLLLLGLPAPRAHTIQPPPSHSTPAIDHAPVAEPPAEPFDPDRFLTTQLGDLPIILSAPHGGTVRVPGSSDRTSGVTVRDLHTAEIALLTYQRLIHRLGREPSLVVAQFSRKDADANRDASEAYENDAAQRVYDAYHAALDRAVRDSVDRFGIAIVIDIHGQSSHRDSIVRGTRSGRTTDDLIARFGIDAVAGPNSLFGELKSRGYPVIPDPEPGELGRETFLNGGYIVAHFGTAIPGADAIQVELGADHRRDQTKMARDLADSIADFAERYLLEAPPPSDRP